MGGASKKCGTGCELCGAVADVHCAADAAFLCFSCDAKVHGANFLASRHFRRSLAAGDAPADSTASSASSSCVSTADSASPARRRGRRRAGAEVVLEGWAKRMGLAAGPARRLAAAAARALRAAGRDVAAACVPLRVAMAAALWSASGGGEGAMLRRLEASAHVPARLVLTVASWMARATKRAAVDEEEGWAECA